MNWRYRVLGGHTHVRVFMHGAKCGDLCFRNEEFEQIRRDLIGRGVIAFLADSTPEERAAALGLPRVDTTVSQ